MHLRQKKGDKTASSGSSIWINRRFLHLAWSPVDQRHHYALHYCDLKTTVIAYSIVPLRSRILPNIFLNFELVTNRTLAIFISQVPSFYSGLGILTNVRKCLT